MSIICNWYDITPQAHYQQMRRRAKRADYEAQAIAHVQKIRRKHKHMGTRKLCGELLKEGLTIGRDWLFKLLKRHNLLVRRKKRRVYTTQAGLWRCENLLAEATITEPNQAWVADITYVETEQGFEYLALVTDLASRRIVGFDVCDTLAVEGALRAVKQAIETAGDVDLTGLIHHSDRGVQYTCHAYRNQLATVGACSSMGETGNCYDNAVAERVNGILKIEYGLGDCFVSRSDARRAVAEAVWLYNHERPHMSLDMQYPDDVYRNGCHHFSLN